VAGWVAANNTVQNCYATAAVNGSNYVGGVAGWVAANATVKDCYATGAVSGTGDCIGGVAGDVEAAAVKDCYATGAVSGTGNDSRYIGGVAGRVSGSGTVQNCYATGAVSGTGTFSNLIGGVAGSVDAYSTVQNCAALNTSIARPNVSVGAVGRVAGFCSGTLSGNIAFSKMTVVLGSSASLILEEGADKKDGAPKSGAEIEADGTLNSLFTNNNNPWTTANGKLPGLFGAAADMPDHLWHTYTATTDPATKTFAATVGYGAQPAQQFTVRNTGTGPLTNVNASIGSFSPIFEISAGLSATTIAAGGTATVSVRPKTGLAVGTYQDELTIAGDRGLSVKVPLSFTVNDNVPSAPTGVSATAGDGQATVTFNAPADNGGAAITDYTVTSSPGDITATGASSPITVTGLTNGTAYTFTVTATNSVGTGLASASSNAVTPTAGGDDTPPVPGSSGTVTVSDVGTTSLKLSWTAATDNITPQENLKYKVFGDTKQTTNPYAITEGSIESALLTNQTSYIVTGLSPQTTYYLVVGVYDEDDNDAFYDIVSATTPAGGVTTGIEDVQQSAKLYAVSTSGGLQLYRLVPGEWFSIYNVVGQLQFTGKAMANEQFVPLRERGVYIVVSGKQRVKVVY
jgi:hypothetical protein